MANATGQEQEFLELINRFRKAPGPELDLLLNSSDSITKANIDGALKQFGTNLVTLRSQWDQLSAVEPLAWSSELNQSAAAHNQVMIDADIQAHTVGDEKKLRERLADVGYDISQGGSIAENIFTSALTIEYGAASLAIDWGEDDPSTPEQEAIDGIQNPVGHRNNLLSANLREVGISVAKVNDPTKENVGPSSVTQNFGNRAALDDKAYLIGVAFDDKNNNSFYQDGEGLSDVQVQITGVDNKFSKTLTVGAAGGYQQLLDPGNYQVDFIRAGEVIQTGTTSISAKNPQNVKLDLALNSNQIAQNNVPVPDKTVIEDPKIIPVEIPTGVVDGIPVTIDMVKRTDTSDPNPAVESEIKLVEIFPGATEIPTGEIDIPLLSMNMFDGSLIPDINKDLVLSVLKFGDNLQNSTSGRNLLDFTKDFTLAGTPDLMSQTITVDFVGVAADASYHNYAGLYRVDDADGSIGNLKPGDAGYLRAALLRSKETNRGVELDQDGISTKSLEGGYIYAPFLVANGTVDQYLNSTDPKTTPNVFCNYIAANADGLDHIKYLGANKFAFEDTLGGGDKDYNDLVFQVDAKIAVIIA